VSEETCSQSHAPSLPEIHICLLNSRDNEPPKNTTDKDEFLVLDASIRQNNPSLGSLVVDKERVRQASG